MKKILGIIILGSVAAAVVAFNTFDWNNLQRINTKQEWVDVSIFYGGEKSRFISNPKIQDILARHKVRLDATKAGSIEMVTSLPTQSKDCLWPSNQIAVQLARNTGKTVTGDTNIFNSAIVFYAWKPISEALENAGIVKREQGVLSMDTAGLINLVQQQKQWKEDLGVNVYGTVRLFSTDPRRSNSGNMWAGLLANMLNDGKVLTSDDVSTVLPQIQNYFKAMGYMESSSGDIFESFLKQGMGARPMIVGYENQLIEFMIENERYRDIIRDKIDIIYPTPTVFANHPLISLNKNCKRLELALQDEELQELAWKEHGFRSGLLGVDNDPAAINTPGIQQTVNQVIPMPEASIMQDMINSLGK